MREWTQARGGMEGGWGGGRGGVEGGEGRREWIGDEGVRKGEGGGEGRREWNQGRYGGCVGRREERDGGSGWGMVEGQVQPVQCTG